MEDASQTRKGHNTRSTKESETFCHNQELESVTVTGGGHEGRWWGSWVMSRLWRGLRFRELDMHPLLSVSTWWPVQYVKTMGRNGQVALAAMWTPQLSWLHIPWGEERSHSRHHSTWSPSVPPLRQVKHGLSKSPHLPLPPSPVTSFFLSTLTNTLFAFLRRHLINLSGWFMGPPARSLKRELVREGWFLTLHTSQGHSGQC